MVEFQCEISGESFITISYWSGYLSHQFVVGGCVHQYASCNRAIKTNHILLMAPETLSILKGENQSSFVFDYTFCYISPNKFWKEGFNWREESFNTFSKKIGWSQLLFSGIFKSKSQLKTLSHRLNYEIEFN